MGEAEPLVAQLPTGIYSPSWPAGPLRQGEILTDFPQAKLNLDSLLGEPPIRIDLDLHPFAVVLSQDCDLAQQFLLPQEDVDVQTTQIQSVLLCEIVTIEELLPHLAPGREFRNRVTKNKEERYHFLQRVRPEEDRLNLGLPELGVDFRRYFAVPVREVYWRLERQQGARRTLLNTPYAEHLCTRFSNYLARIGLPADHLSE